MSKKDKTIKNFYFSSGSKKKKKKKEKSVEKKIEKSIERSFGDDEELPSSLFGIPDVDDPCLVEVLVKVCRTDKTFIGVFFAIMYPGKVFMDISNNKDLFESICDTYKLPVTADELLDIINKGNDIVTAKFIRINSECENISILSNIERGTVYVN